MEFAHPTEDLELAECGAAVFELYQPIQVEVKSQPESQPAPNPQPEPITAVRLPRPNPPLRTYTPPRGGRGGGRRRR